MTRRKLSTQNRVTTQAPPAPRAAVSRRLRLALLVGCLLVIVLTGAWWLLRPRPPLPPPLPHEVKDPFVQQAIERARQDVLTKPDSAAAWGGLGMTLLAHLCYPDADRCFAEAGRLDPADARWPYCRYLIARLFDPTNALLYLRQAEKLGSTLPEYQSALRLQLADVLLERQETEEAEKLYREELSRQPGDPRATLGLGLIARLRGEERAADLLASVRSSPFAHKKATAQLAALAWAHGDSATAEKYETELAALAADPEWPDPILQTVFRYRVGQIRDQQEIDRLEEEGHYAEAAELCLTRLRDEPTAAAYTGAGVNLARVGDYERALPLLRAAIDLEPQDAGSYYRLALALVSRAEGERKRTPAAPSAKEWLREAAELGRQSAALKPDYARAYSVWGEALMNLGEYAEAATVLKKGIVSHPEIFDLQLFLGQSLMESGQLREAAIHLENARKLTPNDPRPADSLEQLHKKQG